MNPGDASKTAAMVAAMRANASKGEDALVNDRWAHRFAGKVGYAAAEHVNPSLELWVALRTRFIDRLVAHWDHDVVLLGAGLDARAARLATPGRRFFEVDHPDTQRRKRAAIADCDDYPANAATFVPCDFETTDFAQALAACGFDSSRPTLFIWEGVSMYLSEDAVTATLTRLAAMHPRSVVVFDHVSRNMAAGQRLSTEDAQTRKMVDDLGEPVTFGTNDILPLMARCGFRHVRTVAFDNLALSDVGDYVRERNFRFQWMVVASPERPVEIAAPHDEDRRPR